MDDEFDDGMSNTCNTAVSMCIPIIYYIYLLLHRPVCSHLILVTSHINTVQTDALSIIRMLNYVRYVFQLVEFCYLQMGVYKRTSLLLSSVSIL
jgi:hypothetical protein